MDLSPQRALRSVRRIRRDWRMSWDIRVQAVRRRPRRQASRLGAASAFGAGRRTTRQCVGSDAFCWPSAALYIGPFLWSHLERSPGLSPACWSPTGPQRSGAREAGRLHVDALVARSLCFGNGPQDPHSPPPRGTEFVARHETHEGPSQRVRSKGVACLQCVPFCSFRLFRSGAAQMPLNLGQTW